MPASRTLKTVALATLTWLLAACTGTEEVATPINLVIADGNASLRVTRLGTQATPTDVRPAGGRVTDLATLEGGRRLAVVFPDRVELRDPDGVTVAATLPSPGFTRCYREVNVNADGTRFVLFSDPSGSEGGALGCDQTGIPFQRVAVYRSNGDFLGGATLPSPNAPTADVHVVLAGNVVQVARQTTFNQVEFRAYDPDGPDANLDLDERNPANPVTVNGTIRDLTAQGERIFASMSDGVRPVIPTGLGDVLLPLPAGDANGFERVWAHARLGLLAAWNQETSLLILRNNAGTTAQVTGIGTLRDLVFTPDGYLYIVQAGNVTRLDVARFSGGGALNVNDRPTVSTGVQDARSAAYTVP